jgi:hypothetical protein
MPIPAKFASLKSLFETCRDNANIATATFFPYFCSPHEKGKDHHE